MDGERFDNAVRTWAKVGSRRRMVGGLLAAAVGLRFGWASAQDETTAAGNGGTADAGANGGAVGTGDVNSGENTGNGAGVGDTAGDVDVDGGAAANATDLDVEADGGAAIADASGGDENVAIYRLTCNPASSYELVSAPGSVPPSDPGTSPAPGLDPLPPLPELPDPDPDPDEETPDPDPEFPEYPELPEPEYPGPEPEYPDPEQPPCTCPCSNGKWACPGSGSYEGTYTCCQSTSGTPEPCAQNPNNGRPNCSGGSGINIPVPPLCIGE